MNKRMPVALVTGVGAGTGAAMDLNHRLSEEVLSYTVKSNSHPPRTVRQ